MVCTPNKPEHARSRLNIDYNKMKEKYMGKHQARSMRTLPGSLNMGVLDGRQKQAIKNITRLQNCLPDKLDTFCKKHLQALLELDICDSQDIFVESVVNRKISTPFKSKKKHRTTANTGLSKDAAAPIYKLISYLEKEADLSIEGLFRKTGNIGRQTQLKEQIQHGSDTDLLNRQYTAHDVATVLKQMISDLPQPLLTEKYYKAYLQIGALMKQSESEMKKQMKALQLMMVLLPQENSQLLKQLLNLLYRVASIPENRMTPGSLGIVFAPSLLCPRTLSAANMQVDSATLSCVVSAMVENAPHVFDFPHELIDDVNQFWKTMENPSKHKTSNKDIVIPCVDKVNSDISIMDNSLQSKDSAPNKTQMMLAKLYAHLRAMPQSTKKKKMLKHKTMEKSSNTECSVNNKNLVRSKKLSKSLKQDFPTLIKVTQQEQCNLSDQVSQSCMDLDRTTSDKPRAGTPYYKNKLNSDIQCAVSPYMKQLSRSIDSPAVCIVDLDASPYFNKHRQYWSCQNLDTVQIESTLPGSEVTTDITVRDDLCRTLFTDGLCKETVTSQSPISKSIDTLSESLRNTLLAPGSRAPVLMFQSPINRLTESFI